MLSQSSDNPIILIVRNLSSYDVLITGNVLMRINIKALIKISARLNGLMSKASAFHLQYTGLIRL